MEAPSTRNAVLDEIPRKALARDHTKMTVSGYQPRRRWEMTRKRAGVPSPCCASPVHLWRARRVEPPAPWPTRSSAVAAGGPPVQRPGFRVLAANVIDLFLEESQSLAMLSDFIDETISLHPGSYARSNSTSSCSDVIRIIAPIRGASPVLVRLWSFTRPHSRCIQSSILELTLPAGPPESATSHFQQDSPHERDSRPSRPSQRRLQRHPHRLRTRLRLRRRPRHASTPGCALTTRGRARTGNGALQLWDLRTPFDGRPVACHKIAEVPVAAWRRVAAPGSAPP